MVDVGKFRNEDFSVYFWLRNLVGDKVDRVIDSYPYTEIENDTLVVPSVSVEHSQTVDEGGELGASWFRRTWAIDVFGVNDAQRDELADIVFKALDGAIPIRNHSTGFREDGKSLLGLDLPLIEWMNPEDRMMRPTYAFGLHADIKFWRATITFSTVSTQANG